MSSSIGKISKSEKFRHFFINVFWGIVIAIIAHYLHYTGLGQTILNSSYDYLIERDFCSSLQESTLSGVPPVSDDIKMVEFTEDTYSKYSYGNYWTPRNILGRSILSSVNQRAKVVIVDFALGSPVPQYCLNNECHDENQEFLKLLKRSAESARVRSSVIILPYHLLNQKAEDLYSVGLKSILEEYRDVIKLGATVVYTNPADNIIRHFGLYEVDSVGDVYLAVQVLGAVFYWHGLQDGEKIINEIITTIKKDEESILLPIPSVYGKKKNLRIVTQDPNHETFEARYIIRLAPREITEKKCQDVLDPLQAYSISTTPEILINEWTDSDGMFDNKIVIVGSSNSLMGDTHYTPIGEVPGMYLIYNSTNVLLQGLQLHDLPKSLKILIEIVIILFAAFTFLYLSPILAAILLGMLLFLFTTTASSYLFSHFGLLMEFWMPVIGIGLHENISNLENAFHKIWRSR